MGNKRIIVTGVVVLGLLGTIPAMAADDGSGITREDIKRLQIDAFAEEMQMEMEQSVHTELANTLAGAQLDIQADVITATDASMSTIPVQPAMNSR